MAGQSILGTVFGRWGAPSGGGVVAPTVMLPWKEYQFAREAGPAWHNSVVALAVGWLGKRFPRPIMRQSTILQRPKEGKKVGDYEPLPKSAAVDLWQSPNPNYRKRAMEHAIGLSLVCDGNAYVMKVRNGGDKLSELWWLPHTRVAPVIDGAGVITGYALDGKTDDAIDRRDVIHFRDGLDPDNPACGMSAMKAQLRQVCTVNEAAVFSAAILKNSGIAGLIFSPRTNGGRGPTKDEAASVKDRVREMFTGTNRGTPAVLQGEYDVHSPGFSPEQLALDKLPQAAMAAIAGASGVPLMVLGHADPGKTYANLEEAIRMAWGVVTSIQELVAESLRYELLPEFGVDPKTDVIEYDYSQIQELKESQDSLWTRVGEAYKGGIITRGVAQELLGLDVDPDGDVYMPGTGGEADVRTTQQLQVQAAKPAGAQQDVESTQAAPPKPVVANGKPAVAAAKRWEY